MVQEQETSFVEPSTSSQNRETVSIDHDSAVEIHGGDAPRVNPSSNEDARALQENNAAQDRKVQSVSKAKQVPSRNRCGYVSTSVGNQSVHLNCCSSILCEGLHTCSIKHYFVAILMGISIIILWLIYILLSNTDILKKNLLNPDNERPANKESEANTPVPVSDSKSSFLTTPESMKLVLLCNSKSLPPSSDSSSADDTNNTVTIMSRKKWETLPPKKRLKNRHSSFQ